jgi:hypothetical protein
LTDEIRCEVSEPRLLSGYLDTLKGLRQKILRGSSLGCTVG